MSAPDPDYSGQRDREVCRLELERLQRPPAADPAAETWRQLLDLLAGLCREAGMLP